MSSSAAPSARPEDPEASRFPAGIPFIVGNEGAERFSYYGMRAILYTYLAALYVQFAAESTLTQAQTDGAKAKATAVAHLFMAGVYAFPMAGAILADRLLGKFPVILFVSLIYCAGHAVLAVAGRFAANGDYGSAELGMYVGLALIAMGSGGIKPCVSANVGDQFTEKNSGLVPKVFQIFYFIINFGSFFSTILTPILNDRFGPEVAFGVPGIFMGIATVIFFLGRKRFVHVPPKPGGKAGLLDFIVALLLFSPVIAIIVAVFVQGDGYKAPSAEGKGAGAFYAEYLSGYLGHLAVSSWMYFALAAVLVVLAFVLFGVRQRLARDDGFLALLVYSFKNRRERKPGEGFFDVARREFGDEAAEGPPAVLRIIVVFSMVMFFWALFDQHASTWVQQAKEMDRSLTVPTWVGRFAIGATIASALYGGTWLMLWVSNRTIPRLVPRVLFGGLALAGVGAIVLDVLSGTTTTVLLKPQQIQALNPLMVMAIIPGLNVLVYQPLERRGRKVKPLVRMSVGMFMAAIAFAAAAMLQARMESAAASGQTVHVLWQVIQYVIMTTSEVLISVTGLEFAYTQAPRRMKSTIMGFWLLGVTFGNVLVAFLAPMQKILTLSKFFWVFTVLMTVAAVAFTLLAARYKGKTYLQGGASH
ncbi:MAG: MFS transporter [Polyangiaceae bacterium]|jgi:POT family proton-dependent oligopeptide transporter|nr:MFS transporter [Polyangiaceae bacterium]MBK8938760.1 MFS transporter [Polyangiaceae bacterium]